MNIPRTHMLAAMAILLANTLPAPGQTGAAAQSPAATHAAALQGDPFQKAPPPDANPPPDAHVTTLMFTVEVYALSQDDAAQVIEQSGSGEARHKAVLALMNEGKARLETLWCGASKSGQRSVLESIDELRYATDYMPTRWKEMPLLPSFFEMRNVGDALEYEPTTSDDEKLCDVNLAPGRVRLLGFPFVYGNAQEPPIVAQPRFQTDKFDTAMTLVMGQTEFLGTISNPPQFDASEQTSPANEIRLAFGKMDVLDLGSRPADTARPAAAPPIPSNIELELTFYSLDREAARQILSEGFQNAHCYDAVKALAGKRQARLERLTVLKTKSGQRAVVQEVNEVRYPTSFQAFEPQAIAPNAPSSSKGLIRPTHFDTRNAGLMLEIEPTIDASGKIMDLNLVPQLVSYEGDLQTAAGLSNIEPQALFETRKVTTSLSARIGEQTLIGTFSHPGDDGVNGRKDTGRTWLGFIRATLN
jgi:hypothetical protein